MRRATAPALTTVATGLVGEDDMIATLGSFDASTDPAYYARTLMTQHHRSVGLVPVVAEVNVGMADARGDQAHQDLVLSGTFHLDRFDLQRAALLAQNSRPYSMYFHVEFPSGLNGAGAQSVFHFFPFGLRA